MRPETGPMEFEEDWRGIFIRGDHALMSFIPALRMLRSMSKENQVIFESLGLDGLIDLLSSANHHDKNVEVQEMKSFERCLKDKKDE